MLLDYIYIEILYIIVGTSGFKWIISYYFVPCYKTYNNIAESINHTVMSSLCPRNKVVTIFISSNEEHSIKCL